VRHVSLTQKFSSVEEALPSFVVAGRSLHAKYLSGHAFVAPQSLEWLAPATVSAQFADLQVHVTAINYKERGVTVVHTAEVPWPVRGSATLASVGFKNAVEKR
jgi:hypothetical protein